MKRRYAPLYATLGLLILTIITFFTLNGRVFPNLELMMVIWVYVAIDVLLFVTLIWGLFLKDQFVKIYTILANIGLIIPLSIWIYLLLLANGISEA
ncbi:hypothetical protein ACFQO8_02395 [Exiguobacterium aestuarii]|uniref:Uncharacterized protein n=1 Tax=Exiguobacterium aestuarii TaxID=273527 RepID=A0ABW2PHL0_9BACL|nr:MULTISPECIES: hypothetical protein [Exiguobacterium]MCT4785808.1 hypothetical protein [Exiguobacterium aestuarii]